MSSFRCEKCGIYIVDTPCGYISGCKHYPIKNKGEGVASADALMEIFGYKRVKAKKK